MVRTGFLLANTHGRRNRLMPTGVICACVCALGAASAAAQSQPENPVYVDDSPRAAEVLGQLDALIAGDNAAEAVRALRALLETEPGRLVVDASDPAVYRSVRALVMEAILARPVLLDRYRQTSEPLAQRLLAEGKTERVEREMLLTPSGFDAAVALAERRFARGAFDAARLLLLQLRDHPDLSGERLTRAAGLLVEIGRFRAEPGDTGLAQAWAAREGVALDAADGDAIVPPESARQAGYSAFEPMSALTTTELLERPLRSAAYGAGEADVRLVTSSPRPWMLPTVAGGSLLINDGDQIESFDAATLERRWVYSPGGSGEARTRGRRARGTNQAVEDTMTVTAGGGVAVAAMGEVFGRRRWGDARLHAVELETGAKLWSAGPSEIDPELGGAMFFGPAVISGDTVVVGLFTFAPLRRVHLCHMAGLDLYTGEPRWVRLVGTAGVLPSQRGQDSAPTMRVRHGIVYRVAPLGIVTAIEAHTGRVAWSRRVASSPGSQGRTDAAWSQPAPIVTGGRVIAVEPDRNRLIVLESDTGHLLGSRMMAEVGWPNYMLEVGDKIVFVGANSYRLTTASGVLTDEPAALPRGEEPGGGRAVVAGGLVIEPTPRGMRMLDPTTGTVRHRRLEHSGAPAVADGQLLVLGPLAVHGYLDWPDAQRVLNARIESMPKDPVPAIALAELAFRAEQFAAIAPAASAALRAIEAGDGVSGADSRRRLYTALQTMLETEGVLGTKHRGPIIDQLALAAVSPSERVGVAMQRGAWHRDAGREREAAAAYQSILADQMLAQAEYQTRWRLERADRAATSALASLVAEEGAEVYRVFAREAADALRLATADQDPGADPDGPALEAIARRYPLARVTPQAWLLAADAYAKSGDRRLTLAALRSGFDSTLRVPKSRETAAVSSELAGRLTASLVESDRVYAALQVIRRSGSQTRQGVAVDTAALERDLLDRLGARDRPAKIGAMPTGMAQMLGGWEIVRPKSSAGPRATSHVLMRSERRGVLALWSEGDEAGESIGFDWESTVLASPDSTPALVPMWTRPLGMNAENEPVVISVGPRSVLLYHGSYEGARFESVDTITGATNWGTPAFGTMFDERSDRYGTGVLETPLDGQVRLRDQLILISDAHVGIVERFGRAVIFDRDTGAPVFASQLDVPMVYEASLRSGVLAVVGERPGDPNRNEGDGVVPMAAAYDVSSGEALYGPEEFRTKLSFGRWVRIADDRTLLIGLDLGVVGVDLSRGQAAWTVDDPAVRLSGDCWTGLGTAYVLGIDRQLWQIDLRTGRLLGRPLEDMNRIANADEMVTSVLPTGGMVFASDTGLAVFDDSGHLIGGDAYDTTVPFREPAFADGLVLTIASRSELRDQRREGDGLVPFRYAAFGVPDGSLVAEADLELHGYPVSIMALDDLILIELDGATAVYHAPMPDEGPEGGAGQ